jgi:hypothetical protein
LPTADNGEADDEAAGEAVASPANERLSKPLTPIEIDATRERRDAIHDERGAAIRPGVAAHVWQQESGYRDKLATLSERDQPRKPNGVWQAVSDRVIAPYFDGTGDDDRELAIRLFTDPEPA